MIEIDLDRTAIRDLNDRLHRLPPDTNERAWHIVNPKGRHAIAVGNRFTVLNRGKTLGTAARGEISAEELQTMMAGGKELAELSSELGGTV